jgi:cell wall-associated NlpC family hydrolase
MTLRRVIWPGLLAGLIALTGSGCASRPMRPHVLPPAVQSSGAALARTAHTLLGTPYRDAGTTPAGFDCSGLVLYVCARHGITMPRDVRRQAASGRPVTREHVAAGDLVFFTTTAAGPTHVGIALDRDRFVHAPRTGTVVRVESLRSAYWLKRYLYARRVTE